jgi:hypothetical protein
VWYRGGRGSKSGGSPVTSGFLSQLVIASRELQGGNALRERGNALEAGTAERRKRNRGRDGKSDNDATRKRGKRKREREEENSTRTTWSFFY